MRPDLHPQLEVDAITAAMLHNQSIQGQDHHKKTKHKPREFLRHCKPRLWNLRPHMESLNSAALAKEQSERQVSGISVSSQTRLAWEHANTDTCVCTYVCACFPTAAQKHTKWIGFNRRKLLVYTGVSNLSGALKSSPMPTLQARLIMIAIPPFLIFLESTIPLGAQRQHEALYTNRF